MNIPGWGIILIIAVILGVATFALYRFGNKQQKKQQEQRQQMYENMQVVSMLVIDKKRMRMSDAGFPKAILDQMPKRASRAKAPVVKAKIGPKVVSLLCDESVYDEVPVKAEIKAQISGIYIMGIKNTRNVAPPEPEKKSMLQKWSMKSNTLTDDEIMSRNENLRQGKNAKNMQRASKGDMKNKALNPSAKKNRSTKKKKKR